MNFPSILLYCTNVRLVDRVKSCLVADLQTNMAPSSKTNWDKTNDTNRRNVLFYGSSNTCEASSTISPPISRITNGILIKNLHWRILRQTTESFQTWDNFTNHFKWTLKCVSACILGVKLHRSKKCFAQNRWKKCNIFSVQHAFCFSHKHTKSTYAFCKIVVSIISVLICLLYKKEEISLKYKFCTK